MRGHLDDNDVNAFFTGALSSGERDAIQKHVDGCSTCRVLVAEVARTSSANRALSSEPPQERVVIRDGKVSRRPMLAATPATLPSRPAKRGLGEGTVLAERYRLEKVLGEGGTGVVWQATHTVMRRRVAIKLLKSAEEEAMKRFFREARVTAALQHPHIVEVHDVFVAPETGTPAMVMELLEGAPLSQWLRTVRGPVTLPLRETARVLLPVVAAVGAAQSVGVVHRDLKPENVFLLGKPEEIDLLDPRVKVLDFGLAKLTAAEGDVVATSQLTRSGFVLGTPHYMSPEQVMMDQPIDHRADVWSLGVILYECLSGTRPIEGTSLSQLFRAIAEPKITPLAKRMPKLPKAVTKLVARMLSKPAKDRPELDEVHDVLTDSAR
jgi:serine/threonine-protein kinase